MARLGLRDSRSQPSVARQPIRLRGFERSPQLFEQLDVDLGMALPWRFESLL